MFHQSPVIPGCIYEYHHQTPAYPLLPIKSATAENLAEFILVELLKEMDIPENIKKLEIGVDEGFGQGAWFEKIVG